MKCQSIKEAVCRKSLNKEKRVILHSSHTRTGQLLWELWMLKVYTGLESNWVHSRRARTPSNAERILRKKYLLYASSDLNFTLIPLISHYLEADTRQAFRVASSTDLLVFFILLQQRKKKTFLRAC